MSTLIGLASTVARFDWLGVGLLECTRPTAPRPVAVLGLPVVALE